MSEASVASVQLSVAVGAVQVATPSQLPASLAWVMSAGMPAMTGSSLSVTVTSKDIVELLPLASVAVYVTVVTPTLKVEPLAMSGVNVPVAQLSLTAGSVQVTTAEQLVASLFWLMSVFWAMSGASSSVTVTVKEEVVTLLAASVDV